MQQLGRFLVGLVAFATAVFPFFFWFDQFHLADPKWPPHARAHLLWLFGLVVMGSVLSLATTIWAWERSVEARLAAMLFPCLVWAACLLEGIFLSPMAGIDHPYSHWRWKVFGEVEANVFGIAAPFILGIVGYILDKRARKGQGGRTSLVELPST